jgi:hypothetical protein
MKLRIGATETLLLAAGLLGLLEQEIVRVLLSKNPSTVISGICFAFVLIGAGVTVSRNFKIGPVEVQMESTEEELSPTGPLPVGEQDSP